MPDWIDHNGRGCPVAPDTMVKVRLRNGNESAASKPASIYTEQWTWLQMQNSAGETYAPTPSPADIVAYLVIEPDKIAAPAPEPTPAELTLAELHRAITALFVRAAGEGVRVDNIDTDWLEVQTMGGPTTHMLTGVAIKTRSTPT